MGTVEVAHEKLIQSWERLQGWLTKQEDRLSAHKEIETASRAWMAAGRNQDRLIHRGKLLEVASGLSRWPALKT